MQILVTGGAGFIGSHLIEYLLDNTHHTIIALDRLDSTVSPNRLTFLEKKNYKDRVKFIWWDLKAEINPSMVFALRNVEVVVHTAASSHVDRSILDPLSFVMDNVVGTCNLLNWLRISGKVSLLLHVSTDEVFGSAEGYTKGFQASHATFPENPYAATKAGAESLVFSYACTYQIPTVMVRMTNVIGIRQHPEKFIPLVIRKVMHEETVFIHTDKDKSKISSRYYIDVRDVCEALTLLTIQNPSKVLIEKGNPFSGIYHISGDKEYDNLHVAETIAYMLGKKLRFEFIGYDYKRPYHDLKYWLDSTETRRTLSWWPKIELEKSLSAIVNWYTENPNWLEIE